MQFISEEYRKLNKQLHEENKHYGNNGAAYMDFVVSLIKQVKSEDVLDYGCGKGQLAAQLPFNIKQYDPAIEKYSALPEPADIVICTDVIEHLEEQYLENILDHIQSLTKKFAYLVIATTEAKKTLPDGRNAHILIRPYQWWMGKLLEYFDIVNFQLYTNRAQFVVAPKNTINQGNK